MHPSLSHVDHRPWSLPSGPWTWRQSWCDLLFAHWPVPVAQLRPLVPSPLQVQEFEGTSWIGVVPFRMQGVMRRPLPDLPYFSAFPELNLRLYVEFDGKPGVWFLSLDAANAVAVWGARRFFHLPYFHSRISLRGLPCEADFQSVRLGSGDVKFSARYTATSEPYESQDGSLENWLTERYCLYAQAPSGRLYRTDVHHESWPLQHAEAEIYPNDLLAPHRLEVQGPPRLLHCSKRIDVVAWPPVELAV